ncbi:lytic polysaccharide monooxygenase [Zopfia rhizophila CBS 207.26]|uniref:lytic cellulose monooxygenase (C4-dehydrogenating) n=1 Tax=Zopfia rhizophila CBS 207.26 TaxID=1314779 RepID=A0A6A6E4J8_9PEZI|nr:lytic polysaccharide monooxygenase [Zopfia rhizophila CBS 207.26]
MRPFTNFCRKLPEQAPHPEYDRRLDPLYNVESVDVRCNRGGSTAGQGVETAIVLAGDEVGFGIANDSSFMSLGRGGRIFHAGPGQAYLSKALADLETYEGDGDWFKIGQYGPKDAKDWVLNGTQYWMNFTIPKTTPPGKYLMRVEHMFPYAPAMLQFYISCAHVQIVGPGGGEMPVVCRCVADLTRTCVEMPSPLVKFPGAYKMNDSNIAILPEHAQFPGEGHERNLFSPKWVNPGPAVWTG